MVHRTTYFALAILGSWMTIQIGISSNGATEEPGAISIASARRDFFSGEMLELRGVTIQTGDLGSTSGMLQSQIHFACASIAQAHQFCRLHDGSWSGPVGLLLPSVKHRIEATLILRFIVNEKIVARAALPIAIYPSRDKFRRQFIGRQFMLVDPDRSVENVLLANKIEFHRIVPQELGPSTKWPVLIGRNAMSSWSQEDIAHWRGWVESGGQAVVFPQAAVPLKEFGHSAIQPSMRAGVVYLPSGTPLGLVLTQARPELWEPSRWGGVSPLPLPQAGNFHILAAAAPPELHAYCWLADLFIGSGRATLLQCAVAQCYENEPRARLLWEAVLEHSFQPVPTFRPLQVLGDTGDPAVELMRDLGIQIIVNPSSLSSDLPLLVVGTTQSMAILSQKRPQFPNELGAFFRKNGTAILLGFSDEARGVIAQLQPFAGYRVTRTDDVRNLMWTGEDENSRQFDGRLATLLGDDVLKPVIGPVPVSISKGTAPDAAMVLLSSWRGASGQLFVFALVPGKRPSPNTLPVWRAVLTPLLTKLGVRLTSEVSEISSSFFRSISSAKISFLEETSK